MAGTAFNSTGRPGLQKRTKSRAKRLGLDVKKSYTRGEARTIKQQLKREKAAPYANRSASERANRRNTAALNNNELAPAAGSKPELRQLTNLQGKPASGVNAVATGRGSARKGQSYRVMKDDKGNFIHVYGRGKSAKRIKLRSSVAAAYGYGDKKKYN